jgi:pimeloyl-ACP methyl ester carboxylesterase
MRKVKTVTRIVIPMLMAMTMLPAELTAHQRSVPKDPRVESLSIGFNGEEIRGFLLCIDARTGPEKQADAKRGSPAGPVLVFFHGHAQRPDDAYGFTSRLALLSRSGLVVVPVCDTPFGADPVFHGDSGKDIVLMEMVRYALALQGFAVAGFMQQTGTPVTVNGVPVSSPTSSDGTVLVPTGWSHGGILARRFAHAHPGSVRSLGQVCPAGYERWSAWGLTGRFSCECLRIAAKMGNGHAGQTFSSAWGFTKGLAGDFFRSVPGAVIDLKPSKLGRIFKDIRDCSAYADSSFFMAAHLHRIAVIFGADDSCMDIRRLLGVEGTDRLHEEDSLRFARTFFADVPDPGRFSLRVLPGTHLAPAIHSELYARTLLEDLGELTGR